MTASGEKTVGNHRRHPDQAPSAGGETLTKPDHAGGGADHSRRAAEAAAMEAADAAWAAFVQGIVSLPKPRTRAEMAKKLAVGAKQLREMELEWDEICTVITNIYGTKYEYTPGTLKAYASKFAGKKNRKITKEQASERARKAAQTRARNRSAATTATGQGSEQVATTSKVEALTGAGTKPTTDEAPAQPVVTTPSPELTDQEQVGALIPNTTEPNTTPMIAEAPEHKVAVRGTTSEAPGIAQGDEVTNNTAAPTAAPTPGEDSDGSSRPAPSSDAGALNAGSIIKDAHEQEPATGVAKPEPSVPQSAPRKAPGAFGRPPFSSPTSSRTPPPPDHLQQEGPVLKT